jgi:rare lipoprotein A
MNEAAVRSSQRAVRRGGLYRALRIALCVLLLHACATTPQPQVEPQPETTLHGVASWYGQEFAGRTTANGEIFDPLLFTAAHRSLPFGTVVDVTNSTTGQTVRVRINDRGPFVGNRMIDLSYAAAQQIGLIDPGSGEVNVKVVSVGRGDREPPAAYTVTVAQPADVKISAVTDAPKIDFPLPAQTTTPVAVVDNVSVVEKHGDTYTRRTVGADGKTIAAVPVVADTPAPSPAPALQAPSPRERVEIPRSGSLGKFVVQVGAFTVEANALALQTRLIALGQQTHIDHDALYRVRLGPFATRDDAIRARSLLEAKGVSAIVVAP